MTQRVHPNQQQQQEKIKVLEWPDQSADLNPIVCLRDDEEGCVQESRHSFAKNRGNMFQTSCLINAQWWNLRWLESVCSSICIDATRMFLFYFILFFIRALKIVQDLDHPVFQKSQIHMSTVGSGFSWSFQTCSQSEKLVSYLPGAVPLQWAGVKHHLAIYYHY